jgi:hypothetical protein
MLLCLGFNGRKESMVVHDGRLHTRMNIRIAVPLP